MQCCSSNCKCLCGYEFEVLGLYINFKDKSLWDVRYALDKWKLMAGVDMNNVRVVYNNYSIMDCDKLGQFDEMDNTRYLESLSTDRINFYTNPGTAEDDYIRMYNYICMHKSLCIFYGERIKFLKTEWENYEKCRKIPCIEIIPNEYCKVFWNGIDDRSYEILYSDIYATNDDKKHTRHH